MKIKDIKKRNIGNLLIGYFFISLSGVLLSFFLPFFLKEKGFNILEIGVLFTIGLAIGSLIFSIVISALLKKFKLKNVLLFSPIFSFFRTFVVYLFPTAGGFISYKFFNEIHKHTSSISTDVVCQHNVLKNDERKISSFSLITNSFGLTVGLFLSVLLITLIGFRNSFLVFALFSIPALFFYSNVGDKARFNLKRKIKIPKLSKDLKLFLFSELLYWFALSSSFALVVTFLVIDKFKGSLWWIAILFASLYFSMVLTTLLTKRFFDKKNLTKSSIYGMIVLLLSVILIIVSNNLYVVLVAFILEGVGAGIWVPSKTAIQWRLTQKENREKVSGYLFGLRGFVSALGPIFGGFLVVFLGILSPFVFKAVTVLIIIFIYSYLLIKIKKMKV